MVDRIESGFVLRNLAVRSLDIDQKEITWELGSTMVEALDAYLVEVQRSESPEGPWDTISPPFSDRYIFIDRRIPFGDKYALLYYRLRASNAATGQEFFFGPATQGPDADMSALAIRRMEMTFFTQVVGRRCWLFKKRTFGPRCRNCWDHIMQKRTVDRCLDCFGTGILRGYHNPIEVWVQIDPSTKMQQNNAQQIAQFVNSAARMSFYPDVKPGDVLIEMENKRWRVQSVTLSERLRAPVKQELVIRQIEETDIEYKLPLRLDKALKDIQPSPVRMFENATDIHSSIANRTSNIFEAFMTYPGFRKGDER